MLVCVCVQSKINRSTKYTHMRTHTHTYADIPVYPVPNSAIQADQAGPAQTNERASETGGGRGRVETKLKSRAAAQRKQTN